MIKTWSFLFVCNVCATVCVQRVCNVCATHLNLYDFIRFLGKKKNPQDC